jgi:O-antigen/teichoic acid export membrane protein
VQDSNKSHEPKRLAGGTAWNLLGQVGPFLLAAFLVPGLLRRLGVERFGLLSLAWTVIGFSSVLDLGVSRAMVRSISAELSLGRNDLVASLVRTGLLLLAGISLIAALLIAAVGWSVLKFGHSVSGDLQGEAIISLLIVSLTAPLVILNSGFRALLEARQQFRTINLIRIPIGVSSVLGPYISSRFTPSLPVAIGAWSAIWAISCAAFGMVSRMSYNRTIPGNKVTREAFGSLLGYGSWITVSNVISAILTTADRFAITTFWSAGAVAYYSVPQEVTSKMLLVPRAVTSTLFPILSGEHARDPDQVGVLTMRALRWLLAVLFPACLLLSSFGSILLSLWLGEDYSQKSSRVMSLLAISVFINGSAYIPFTALQACGRAAFCAKLHLLEISAFLPALAISVMRHGTTGAALCVIALCSTDALVLFWGASRLLRSELLAKTVSFVAGGFVILAGSLALPADLRTRAPIILAVILAYLFSLWTWSFDQSDRDMIRRFSW